MKSVSSPLTLLAPHFWCSPALPTTSFFLLLSPQQSCLYPNKAGDPTPLLIRTFWFSVASRSKSKFICGTLNSLQIPTCLPHALLRPEIYSFLTLVNSHWLFKTSSNITLFVRLFLSSSESGSFSVWFIHSFILVLKSRWWKMLVYDNISLYFIVFFI